MFQAIDIKKAVVPILASLDRTTGAAPLRDSLRMFSEVWNSRDCVHYRGSFGKLALMAQEGGTQREGMTPMYDNVVTLISDGNDLASKGSDYDKNDLFGLAASVFTRASVMEVHHGDLDKYFASN